MVHYPAADDASQLMWAGIKLDVRSKLISFLGLPSRISVYKQTSHFWTENCMTRWGVLCQTSMSSKCSNHSSSSISFHSNDLCVNQCLYLRHILMTNFYHIRYLNDSCISMLGNEFRGFHICLHNVAQGAWGQGWWDWQQSWWGRWMVLFPCCINDIYPSDKIAIE